MPLRNLRPLRDEMRNDEQAVIVIRFAYRQTPYFLAICLLTDDDRKNPDRRYDLVRLCFMHEDNLSNYLDCYANSNSISAGLTELRHFLGVEFQEDGIGWARGFLQYLGTQIPRNIPIMDDASNQASLVTICRHEGRDPNRTYRWSMIRHLKEDSGKQKHRTEYNGQLVSSKFPVKKPPVHVTRRQPTLVELVVDERRSS